MITIADRKYIENKYHDTNKPFNPFRRMQYHGYEYPNNGLSDSEIGFINSIVKPLEW